MKTTFLIIFYLFPLGMLLGQIGPDNIVTICSNCHFTAKGFIMDAQTNKPIKGAVVTKVGSDGSVDAVKTDSTGFYFFDSTKVHASTSYIISANGSDAKYLASQFKATISTVGETKSKMWIEDFKLQKAEADDRFFPYCRFKFGCALAVGNLPDSLDYVVKLLQDNPNITLEADGHGSPDEKDAQVLSLARAIICRDYLISQGIDSSRIVVKGWGVTNPLPGYSKDDIAKMKTKEEKVAACEADRRVEFRVLSFTYTPKNK